MRCRGAHQHYRLRGCGIFLQPFLCSVYGMGTSIINSRWGAFWRPTLFLLRPRTSATPRRASTTLRARSRATPRRASTNSRTRSRSRTAAPTSYITPHATTSPNSRTRSRTLPTRRTRNRTRSRTRAAPAQPSCSTPHTPNAQPHSFPHQSRTSAATRSHALKPLFRRTISPPTPLARSYLCNRANSTIMSPCAMRVSM